MMLAERMDLLTKRPQGTLFPPAQNRAAWEALPADDRMDMETFIAKWRGTPYPMLLLSDYAAFVRTGSRAQCETPYFARRRKLIAAVLDVCLHGESGAKEVSKYKMKVQAELGWNIINSKFFHGTDFFG